MKAPRRLATRPETPSSSAAIGRRASARARAVARRAVGLFPLTPLGVLGALGAALGVKWLAYLELDLVILVVGYGSIALAALALLFVVVGALRVAWALRRLERIEDRRLETERSLPTGFTLPRLALLPLVRVRWSWEQPRARITLTPRRLSWLEHAALAERGRVSEIVRRIVVEDAFGLARIAFDHRQEASLVTLPHRGALGSMPLLVSMAGGEDIPHPMGVAEGDRVDLRRYEPGDPARFIHWKIFARSRRLMVRMPERALTRSKRTVSYLVAGARDEASAAAARVAIESGVLGDEWTFGADGTLGASTEVPAAIESIVRSIEARAAGASQLQSFVDHAERTGPISLVLFVPPTPGPWLARALAVVSSRASRARVVIGIDGVDRTPERPRWWRWFLATRAPDAALARDLDEVANAFAALRAEVVVLDRVSGKRLGEVHRRALEGASDRARTRGEAA